LHKVHAGNGKPGKSWNFTISFSRPGVHGKRSLLYRINLVVALSVNKKEINES